jgi:hypothetical protein
MPKPSAASGGVNKKAIVIGGVLVVMAVVALWLNFGGDGDSGAAPQSPTEGAIVQDAGGVPSGEPTQAGQALPEDEPPSSSGQAAAGGGSTGPGEPSSGPRQPPKGSAPVAASIVD